MAVLPVQEDNRLPLGSLKAPVDAFGFDFDISQEVVIALDMGAAGSANLDKGEFFPIDRVLLEQPLNGQKALQNALGVIDAIHSHPEEQGFHPGFLQQLYPFRVSILLRLNPRTGYVHADWKWLHCG